MYKRQFIYNLFHYQITQNFINQHVSQTSVFGPPGQVFLYEWSKFRYGVFEEHGYPGDPLYPMFYSKQIFTAQGAKNIVKPNLCTNIEPTGCIVYNLHKLLGLGGVVSCPKTG